MSQPAEQLPPGQFGPVSQGGRDRSRGGLDWRRIAIYVTAFVGTLVVTATATLGGLVYAGTRGIEQARIPDLRIDQDAAVAPEPEAAEPAANDPGIEEVAETQNILVVGSDSRDGLTDEQLLALGTEDEGGNLTDTVMLLQLDPAADRAALLSFPRDLLVERCDGTRGRINSAFSTGEELSPGGGPACLVKTVADLTQIPIDHYVEVNLLGFIDAVDAVGGVTFFLDEPIVDQYAGLDVPEGCVTFDGTRALGFVRARRVDNDFGRIARQQRFLRELIATATSIETMSNPPRLFGLVRAVSGAVTTDTGLSTTDMARLAYTFRELSNSGLTTYTVPGTPGQWGEGASVVFVDEVAAPRMFSQFRDGSISTAPPQVADRAPASPRPAPSPTPPGPGDVPPVLVQNGAGVPGLADDAAAALAERGYEVLRTENADNFGYTRTRILYPPAQEPLAEILADSLPDARLEEVTDDDQLAVVLGADWDTDALPEPEPSDAPEPDAAASEEDASDEPSDDAAGAPALAPTGGPSATPPGATDLPGESSTVVGPTPSPAESFEGAQFSDVRC